MSEIKVRFDFTLPPSWGGSLPKEFRWAVSLLDSQEWELRDLLYRKSRTHDDRTKIAHMGKDNSGSD